MNCPEHLVFKTKGDSVYLWLYWRDVPRDTIPLRVWLNPLQYELFIRAFGRVAVINREGLWASRLDWRIRRALCKTLGHRFTPRAICNRCLKQKPTTGNDGAGHGGAE